MNKHVNMDRLNWVSNGDEYSMNCQRCNVAQAAVAVTGADQVTFSFRVYYFDDETAARDLATYTRRVNKICQAAGLVPGEAVSKDAVRMNITAKPA